MVALSLSSLLIILVVGYYQITRNRKGWDKSNIYKVYKILGFLILVVSVGGFICVLIIMLAEWVNI